MAGRIAEWCVEDRQAEVRALRIGQQQPRTGVVGDARPGPLIDQPMEIAREEVRIGSEMILDHPREALVAMVDLGDGSTLAVDEQVVAASTRQVLDPGRSLPAAGFLDPRSAAHGHADLVEVLEFAIVLHLGDDDVDPGAHLAERARNSVGEFRVGLAVDADENAVSGLGGTVTDEPGGGSAYLVLADDLARDVGQVHDPRHATGWTGFVTSLRVCTRRATHVAASRLKRVGVRNGPRSVLQGPWFGTARITPSGSRWPRRSRSRSGPAGRFDRTRP